MSGRPVVTGYTPLVPTRRKETLKAKYNLPSRDSGRGVSPNTERYPNTYRSSKELSEVDFSTISQELARNLPLKIHQKKEGEIHDLTSAEDTLRTLEPDTDAEVPPLSLGSLNPTPRPVSSPAPTASPRSYPGPAQRGHSLVVHKKTVLNKLNKKEKEIKPYPLDSPVQHAVHLNSYPYEEETETVSPNSTDAEDVVVPNIYVKEPTQQHIDIEGRFISVPEYQESFDTNGITEVSADTRYVLEDDPDPDEQPEYRYPEPKNSPPHVRKNIKDSRNRLKQLRDLSDSDQEVSGVPKVRSKLPILRDRGEDKSVSRIPRRKPKKHTVSSQRKELRSEPSGRSRDHHKKRLDGVNKKFGRAIPVGFDRHTQSDFEFEDRGLPDHNKLRTRLNNVHKKHERLIPVGYNTQSDFEKRVDKYHKSKQTGLPVAENYYSDFDRKPRQRQPRKPPRETLPSKPPTKPKLHVRRTDTAVDSSDQESYLLSRPPKHPSRKPRRPLEDARHQPIIPHKLFDEYGREYIVRHPRPHTFAPNDLNDSLAVPHRSPATYKTGVIDPYDLLPPPIPSVPSGKELKSSSHTIPVSSQKIVFYDGDNKVYVTDDYLHRSVGQQKKSENARRNFERRLVDHIHDQQHGRDHLREDTHYVTLDALNMDDYNQHTEISPYALEKLSAKKFFKDMGRLPEDRPLEGSGNYRKERQNKDYNLRGSKGVQPLPAPRGYSGDRGGHHTPRSEPHSRSYSRNTYNVPQDQTDTSIDPQKNQIHIYSYGPLNINSSAPGSRGEGGESVPENPNEKGTSTDAMKKSGTGYFLGQGQGRDGFRYVNEDLDSSDTPQNRERMRTDLSWRKKNSASSKKNVYVVKTPNLNENMSTGPTTQTKQIQTMSDDVKEVQTEPEKDVVDSETQKYEPGSLEDIKQRVREIWQALGPQPVEEEEEKVEELDDDMYFDADEDAQYVMCLVTDDGDIIGPFSMEIDEVQMGFGKMLLERHPELMTVPSDDEKQDGQEKDETEAKDKDGDAEGLRNRISSPNDMNEFSSRSHTMLQLMIDNEIPDPDDENLYITKHGKLTFVDLAGSEKVKDSTITSGEFMAETNNINKSLLVLGNCISALADSKKRGGHIPYRDSKLTKLLADSIGGSGVTLMIACVSPSNQNTAETMNTLRYANRAKKIKNKPIVKMDPREKLILTLKRELKILRQENHYLRQQLNFPEKPRGKLQKENDEQFLKLMKQNAKKSKDKDDPRSDEDFNPSQVVAASSIFPPAKVMPITDSAVQTPSEGPTDSGGKPPLNASEGGGLYEMLQEYMVENETLRSENQDLQGFKDKTRRDQQNLSHENERLQRRLEEIERLLSSEVPNRFGNIDPQYPYSDPNVAARGRQGSYGDLAPVDYRGASNGYPGNSPPNSNSQSRTRQRSVPSQQHLPLKPPHHLNEPVTPRGSNASYPGQSYSEKFQQRMDQRDSQGGYSPPQPQTRGPPPSGPPSGYYAGYNDQNAPRYGSQTNNRRGSGGLYEDQDPVPTPRRKPGPTPDPIPRKSTTNQPLNPQGGTGTHH